MKRAAFGISGFGDDVSLKRIVKKSAASEPKGSRRCIFGPLLHFGNLSLSLRDLRQRGFQLVLDHRGIGH